VRKRPLGKTGIDVSELGLGTWGLSGDAYGPVTDAEADRVIDRAVQIGITVFDTADVYGEGAMEKRLGKRLPIGKTTVVTKIGTNLSGGYAQKQFDASHLWMSFDRSQERLNRNPVDVVLLHNPSLYTLKKDEPFEVLESLKAQGRLKAWGVSAGSVAVAQKAIERGAELVEMPYNCTFYGDVEKLGPELREKNIGLLARSVLAHGLLAGHWSTEREFYPPDHRADRWNPEDLKKRVEQVSVLKSLVGGAILSMRAAALRFVLENADVSSAILGPRSCAQLDQLVREAGRMPPYFVDGVMKRLFADLRAAGVSGE
jgi:aryl-alcohol dehydrogenase-like predicted oxidoreductase